MGDNTTVKVNFVFSIFFVLTYYYECGALKLYNSHPQVKGLAHVGLGKYLDYLASLLLSSLQGLVEGKLKIMWTTSIQLKSSEQHMRASSLLYLTRPCGPNLTMDFSCIHLY